VREGDGSELRHALLGTKVSLKFSVVKVLDYRGRWEELERSNNPFAIVVMAYLRMFETRRDPRKRLEWKLILTRMLYDRGYSERDVVDLFRFLDWLMFLPDDLQHEYRDELERFEEERKMPYVTTIERMGIEKGREQGVQQGSAEIVVGLLQMRLGVLDEKTLLAVRALTFERIRELSVALLNFSSTDDLADWLREHASSQ
jgi:hypothetical protein